MQATVTYFPAVSIVVPTFNRGDCIGSCLESALAQTYGEFELIVVDDASSDDTAVRVKHFKDSRVRYLQHDVNRGGAAARNTGIRASTGEFVAFLDSDDVWHPEKLEEQVAALHRLGPAWGLSYTWMSRVDSSGAEVSRANPRSKEIAPSASCYQTLSHLFRTLLCGGPYCCSAANSTKGLRVVKIGTCTSESASSSIFIA